jgi:hypothetical protein
MAVNGYRAGSPEHLRQPAGMIVVAMADGNGPDRCQVFAHGIGVSADPHALAGIEKHIPGCGFNQTGESVFTHHTGGTAHGIFAQDGQFRFHQAIPDK